MKGAMCWFNFIAKWFPLAEPCGRSIQCHLEGVPASSLWAYWHRNRSFTAGSKHSFVWSVYPSCGSHGQYSAVLKWWVLQDCSWGQFFHVITVINNTQYQAATVWSFVFHMELLDGCYCWVILAFMIQWGGKYCTTFS
jgi:hypothetical protein